MNLHSIVRGVIPAVNPDTPATVQISNGYTQDANYRQVPAYQTPGTLTASIAVGTLDVTAAASGYLAAGQTLDGASVLAGTKIIEQLTGTPGGIGTYSVLPEQTVASEAMTTSLAVKAQVQALTFRDLTQIDGLNLQGTRRGIYLFGKVDGLVRAENKGGDLIAIADGVHAGIWLVAMVLEQWPGWVKVAATQQNGA